MFDYVCMALIFFSSIQTFGHLASVIDQKINPVGMLVGIAVGLCIIALAGGQ